MAKDMTKILVHLGRVFLPVLMALASVPGCAETRTSGVPIVPTTGTVTLDGRPIAGAHLEFIPVGDTRGQGGSARAAGDGSYTATTPFGETGLPSGQYRVTIKKFETRGAPADPPDDFAPADSPYRQTLPPDYSDDLHTKLTATVISGEISVINFQLKSPATPKKGRQQTPRR